MLPVYLRIHATDMSSARRSATRSAAMWPLKCTGKGGCGNEWKQLFTSDPSVPGRCPRCGKTKKIPQEGWRWLAAQRAAAPPPAPRPQAGQRFGAGRVSGDFRGPDEPPRHAIVAEDEEDQAQPAGPVFLAAGAARMAEGIGRMLARQRPGLALPDARVVEGVVIPPSRLPVGRDPAAVVPPDLDGKQPLRARLRLSGQRREPEPEHGSHVVPRDAKFAPVCGACRNEPRRAATWTAASSQLELWPWAVAAGFPAVLELCGNHVRQVPAELIAVRRGWERGGWVLIRDAANEARQSDVRAVVQQNRTLSLSGRYG